MISKNPVLQIRQDLLPVPGRARDATKVTVAALIVCLFMFSTSMPFVDLGVYLVFLMVQRDSMRTRMLAGGGIVVAGLATLLVVGVMVLAWDVTWLRLLLWTLIFFVGFFFMRVFIEPNVFLGALVIGALCTYITDQVPLPNLLLDQIGWLWALLPVVVSTVLLVDWLFGSPTPRRALQRQVWLMFSQITEGMRLRANGKEPVPLDPEEVEDAIRRISLLVRIRVLSSAQAARCAELLRCLARVEFCAEGVGSTARTGDFWRRLAECLAAVQVRLERGRAAPLPPGDDWPQSAEDDDLARAVAALRDAAGRLENAEPAGAGGRLESAPILLPDWKTNPAYLSFALRATGAIMGAYLFMSLTQWNGIHTCMVTCVVTALSSVDAQVRKQNLRMAGAAVGAVAGVGALLFILPAHQSLLALLLVLGVTSFGAAWVAVGPLRISYAGLQIALAVYYVLLAEPHISTELAPIRDRLIGIFVGIFAMRAAFVWVAPEGDRGAKNVV